MQRIEFRGKRFDTKEWVYGDYNRFSTTYDLEFISTVNNGTFQVDKDTAGQFIGIKDSQNNKIFQGDLVNQIEQEDDGCIDVFIYEVVWSHDNLAFMFRDVYSGEYYLYNEIGIDNIIGNIHDHPELSGDELWKQ